MKISLVTKGQDNFSYKMLLFCSLKPARMSMTEVPGLQVSTQSPQMASLR